jgi:hypothetical protein
MEGEDQIPHLFHLENEAMIKTAPSDVAPLFTAPTTRSNMQD